jgi:hypothetical protein
VTSRVTFAGGKNSDYCFKWKRGNLLYKLVSSTNLEFFVSRRHLLACGRCKIRHSELDILAFLFILIFKIIYIFMKLKDYIYFEAFIINFFSIHFHCIFINFDLVFLFLNCDRDLWLPHLQNFALYFDIEFCM